jgi:hypothetical protein
MPVTREDVVNALLPEEPDYTGAALALGAEALPILEELEAGDDIALAVKGTYLAGLLPGGRGSHVVRAAAESDNALLRAAAASTVRNLPATQANQLLLPLLDDGDAGIRKLALASVPDTTTDEVRDRLADMARTESIPALAELSRELHERTS